MKWLDELATTNFRIAVSIIVSVLVVLILTAVGLILNRPVQDSVMYAVLGFLGLMLGLDVTQFVQKRKTTLVTPPMTTAENATSVTVTDAPLKPVLTREGAQAAADVYAGAPEKFDPPGEGG